MGRYLILSLIHSPPPASFLEFGAERKRPGKHSTEIPVVKTAPIRNRTLGSTDRLGQSVTLTHPVLQLLGVVLLCPKPLIPEPRQVAVRCRANGRDVLHCRPHPHRLL